jgi:thioredoxin-related protein
MKTLSMLLLAAATWFGQAEWGTDFEQAKAKAKAEEKLVLVNFSGSDWCAPCIKMKKNIFEQTVFTDYADANLVLVRADFPRSKKNKLDKAQQEQNDALAAKYNPKGTFPLTLLLNAEGKVIKKWEGLPKLEAKEFVTAVRTASNGK